MHLIVSVNASDLKKVTELTEERGYSAIHISPLNAAEREEIALVRQFGLCYFVVLLISGHPATFFCNMSVEEAKKIMDNYF